MNKIIYTFIIFAVIVAGVYLWQKQSASDAKLVSNVETLRVENATRIVTQADVEYFPGARGYFVRPFDSTQGEPEVAVNYPGVVMIHENRGLRPETRQAAELLAKEGYLVLAVDLLGGMVETQDEARQLTAKYDQKTGIANMRAAAAYLRTQGATKIASLGWCFGGKQSVELAISGEKLDATVVYYGGGMATTTERLAPIAWPILGVFGDQDQVIPIKNVRAFEASLNTLGVQNEIYIYPGVGHAFANPSGMSYAPEATKDAWSKTIAFLKKYL